ncbi:MAG: glycosyltransferase family 4 protein [Gaiellaceae bacterium]
MRRLVFMTQRLDQDDPALGATVPMVRALAARVDEIVVLCDSALPEALPANARVHRFGSGTRAGRGLRFEAALARELRPRPDAVIAHMIALYAVLAAPLVRPLGIPLVLWYTHWRSHALLRAAARVSTAIASVDRTTFPLESAKVHVIGHGIDVSEFSCSEAGATEGPLRALALGRYSPAKGLDHVVRGLRLAVDRGCDARLEVHGVAGSALERDHERWLGDLVEELRLGERVDLGGPVPRAELRAVFGRSDVLINNMRAGAADKVVYEAAASCLPVLASNPVFEQLIDRGSLFDRESPESLADRLLGLDRRRRPELRARVLEHHSVEAWAEGILAAAA